MDKMINPRHDIQRGYQPSNNADRSVQIYFSNVVAFYFLLSPGMQGKEWSFYIILSGEFLAHVL